MSEQQETQSNEIKAGYLTIQVERSPGCQIKLDVQVSKKGIDVAEKKAIKSINKQVTLPGFRKGRAPAPLVREHYGSHVDQEVREQLVRTTFAEAVEAVNLYPSSQNALQKPKVVSLDKEQANLVFSFESVPETPLIDPV